MNIKQFDEWLKKLSNAWIEKDPQAAVKLFSKNIVYYETPFEKPYTTKEDILRLWQVVPKSQKDVKFFYEILTISGNAGIAHWIASFTRIKQNIKADLDGIFLVQLNKKGLCKLFKQWWVTKESSFNL